MVTNGRKPLFDRRGRALPEEREEFQKILELMNDKNNWFSEMLVDYWVEHAREVTEDSIIPRWGVKAFSSDHSIKVGLEWIERLFCTCVSDRYYGTEPHGVLCLLWIRYEEKNAKRTKKVKAIFIFLGILFLGLLVYKILDLGK